MQVALTLLFAINGWSSLEPVSEAEFAQAFYQVESSLAQTGGFAMPPEPTEDGRDAVSRSEILAEMERVYDAALPQFKFTLRPQKVIREAIESHNPPEEHDRIVRLVENGLVAPVGPLVTGPGDTIGPDELGDALGFFAGRVSAHMHMPTPLWSPQIQPTDAAERSD